MELGEEVCDVQEYVISPGIRTSWMEVKNRKGGCARALVEIEFSPARACVTSLSVLIQRSLSTKFSRPLYILDLKSNANS
jgi:hypothetical protein